MFWIKKELIIITTTLNLTLLKNNNVKLIKNNIAYSNYFDKILFEIDGTSYYLIIKDNNLIFHKEDNEYIFDLNINESSSASLTLKELNQSFDIDVLNAKFINDNNKKIIEYFLSSDETPTRIEITLENR